MGRGSTNVLSFGARGDGSGDDTAAFATAVGAAAAGDGVLLVPNGVYRINPLQSIVLPSGIHLSLAPGAVLQAIPVVEGQSAVIAIRNVANVRVSGGTVVGERLEHRGTTGEWGFGIDVRGSADVTLDGVTTRDCWGDGIYIGAGAAGESRRVTVRGCTGTGHRRQGLSITACLTALIEQCEFRGIAGTVPESGIDIEPNLPYAVRDVTVRACLTTGNAGGGILVQGETTSGCVIERNQCSGNGYYGGILVMLGASRCTVQNNLVEWNRGTGIHVRRTSGHTVNGNTVRHNSQAQAARWPNLWLHDGASGNTVRGNVFADPANTPNIAPNFDILIDADCGGNRIGGNTVRPRRADAGGQMSGGVLNLNASNVVEDDD